MARMTLRSISRRIVWSPEKNSLRGPAEDYGQDPEKDPSRSREGSPARDRQRGPQAEKDSMPKVIRVENGRLPPRRRIILPMHDAIFVDDANRLGRRTFMI